MPIGRNVDEYLRLIDAKNHVDKHGEVCPLTGKREKMQWMLLDKELKNIYLSNETTNNQTYSSIR